MPGPHCRFCNSALTTTFVDLGTSPLANDYLSPEALRRMEAFYPLHAFVCDSCLLVQVEAFEAPERIFRDYAYFSSYSRSWLEHARTFAVSACERFQLGARSFVIEVASNDGYLLTNFHEFGIPILGIEPAENVAEVARSKGIPTISRFMGEALADDLSAEGKRADLLIGINVLAHVPSLHDFVAGLAKLLKPEGTLCLEFPHLLQLIEQRQFDTIYHEHFSYFSLLTATRILAHHGLAVFDVDELPTHGGSLRLFVGHRATLERRMTPAPALVLAKERKKGLDKIETYEAFSKGVWAAKRDLLRFLIDARERGKTVVGYGAPAKGNTLLNFCGIREDLLAYTVDISPHKQGRFLPGTHIPIYSPDRIERTRPDYVLILPWNLRDEIVSQLGQLRAWDGRCVTPLPRVEVIS
jgi:2-polyprenyl-3-methyl-5-hydroxy-6-metoxy-1,4-benzoquinol methylase